MMTRKVALSLAMHINEMFGENDVQTTKE
jgi:hypothetical protein